MRTLVLMRACPGAGKSYFIKEHNLEPYTLSADQIRLQYCSPILNLEGNYCISQRNDNIVWDKLFEMLEYRMELGCFTIIDATNSKTSEMQRYKDLCQKYRYRIYCIDMTDVPIEVCKVRNNTREPYKRVPEEVIDNIYSRFATQKIPGGIKVIKPSEFDEVMRFNPIDLSEYDNVYVIGDTHGCFTTFQQFNNDIVNYNGENNFFIFCGDYSDRGTENAEMLKFLYGIKDNKNVLLLEGNHECFAKGTEVLTIDGWKHIEEVTKNDYVANFDINTTNIQYDHPNEIIKNFSETIYHIETERVCQYVTPNHDIIYDSKKIKAKDLSENFGQKGFILSGNTNNTDYPITNEELRLLVWLICDGTIVLNKKYNPNSSKVRLQWHLSREDKITNLTKLLDKMNFKYTIKDGKIEDQQKKQPVLIRVYGKYARHIVSLLDNEDFKEFPTWFKYLSREQAKIVVEELGKTDGTLITSKKIIKYSWTTTSLKNLNVIQHMCIINGMCCTYRKNQTTSGFKKGNGKLQYSVTINTENVWSSKKKNNIKEILPYNNYVYCLSMPLGTLITRYEGKIAFSGNCHVNKWGNDDITSIRSKEFLNYTMPELDYKRIFTKKMARELYRKLAQCAYFTYGNETFFVCHGGLSSIPDNLIYVPTRQMIDGVGKYSDYKEMSDNYAKYNDIILINGHRNINKLNTKVNDKCYNLEGAVEFGGNLRVLRIGKNLEKEVLEYSNKLPIAKHLVKQKTEFTDTKTENVIINDNNDNNIGKLVHELRNNKYIIEKQFGNISSFNFSREAFEKGIWDDMTVKARGLYIDTVNNRVQSRGYEKFFRVNEVEETKLPSLARTFKFPIDIFQKENGYLGLISYDYYNDDLFFTTKSTPDGDYSINFKNLFYSKIPEKNRDLLKIYLKNNNYTLAVEVIDPVFDPHIIEYSKSKIVGLDLIKNTLNFEVADYMMLGFICNQIGIDRKKKIGTLNNWEEFEDFYNNAPKDSVSYSAYPVYNENIEGWVLKDSNGFMVKIKSDYYNMWKKLRGVAGAVIKSGNYKYTGALQNPTENYFFAWIKENWELYHYNDTLPRDIITLRKEFYNSHYGELVKK